MNLFSIMKSKIFVSYLLSFLALILLPLTIISILISSSFNSSAQKQYLQTEQLMLRAVSEQLDSYVELPINISSKLVQLRSYRLFNVSTAFTAYERQNSVFEISRYLNGLIRNDICTNYCVYFTEPDTLISSSGSTHSFADYYRSMLNYKGVSEGDFYRWIQSVEQRGYSGLLTTSSGQQFFCLAQVLPSAYLHRTSYLLSFFSAGRFQNELEQKLMPGSYYRICTPEQELIASNLPETAKTAGEGHSKIEIDGIQYLQFSESPGVTQMQYDFYVPEAAVFEALLRFQRTFWLIFGAVFLGSVFLAFLIAFRRYAPIQKLFVQVFPNSDSNGEDFDRILQRFNEMNRQDQYYADEIQSQSRKLRDQLLIQILTTSGFDEKKLQILLNEYNLVFTQPRFYVIVVCGCPAEQLEFDGSTLCPFPITSYCALIVNDSPQDPAIERICHSLEELQAAMPEMQVNVSSPCGSLQGLHHCFREALRYNTEPLPSQVQGDGQQPVFYPVDRELEILNTLCNGDYPGCKRLLTELYEENRSLPVPMLFCLLHSMTATACHVYYTLNHPDKRPLQHLESVLSCADSSEHCFQFVLQFYQSVAELCGQPGKSKNEHVVSAIIQYIHQHYADPNLSLNTVAAAFHVSYYYLSHIFSDEVRQSFSNLLNICRVEHAKQLLAESKLTAQDIAVAVGYTNSSTFFRTFRKLTGLTPNDYRIQQRKE